MKHELNVSANHHTDVSIIARMFLLQAKEEQKSGAVLVGKVMIPCSRGNEQTHCLVLSQQQLQRVHRLLMT